MMKKVINYIVLLLPIIIYSQNGGVSIGTNGAAHPSAILEIGNQENKGVLFPKVELLDNLSDYTTPILNPVNGMVVYNIGNAQIHGYYFGDNNQWKLMGDSYNVVADAVCRMTTPLTSFLANKPIGTIVSYYNGASPSTWSQFSNNISGFSSTVNGNFTVPAGSYLVHVNANISIPDLSPTNGIYNDLHLIKLKAALISDVISPVIPVVYGEETADNGVLRSTVHNYNTNFDFSFTLDSPKVMKIALVMDSGGTYSNGIGGIIANNGGITINNISIHFQRIIAMP